MRQKILFLIPYPVNKSPSQRFRFEQYLDLLKNGAGHEYIIQSFLDAKNSRLFYSPGKIFRKVMALARGFVNRVFILAKISKFDFVFIHREVAPIGPPVFEFIISKIFNKKIIYDFDDAIWLTDRKNESRFASTVRWRTKVKYICKWSYKVSCGNEFLADFARTFNQRVIVNPTTIDTIGLHNPQLFSRKAASQTTVGWTGSHSTIKYLKALEPVLQKLELAFPSLQIIVIADRSPDLQLKSMRFIEWREATEIDDLNKIDIGVMPLPDDEWSKGKCGFKVLQYMALNIPAVASYTGVNSTIIQHGENGFLCATEAEWESALTALIKDNGLRIKIGEKGREKVSEHYSVVSNSSVFLSLFE